MKNKRKYIYDEERLVPMGYPSHGSHRVGNMKYGNDYLTLNISLTKSNNR